MIKNLFNKKTKDLSKPYPKDTIQHILNDKLPRHVAVMMDGNGRWATEQDKPREFGHRNALKSVEETIQSCIELKIPYLTLYAFSTENWQRPLQEVEALMDLFVSTIHNKLNELIKNDIRFLVIGDIDRLPVRCQEVIKEAVAITQKNKTLQLIVALSYSGRWDIVQAIKKLMKDILDKKVQPQDINPSLFQTYLSTYPLPDPDVLIRTGGDMRISNFYIWEVAYTEIVIVEKYWPQFRKSDFYEAILTYQKRERRFGKLNHNI